MQSCKRSHDGISIERILGIESTKINHTERQGILAQIWHALTWPLGSRLACILSNAQRMDIVSVTILCRHFLSQYKNNNFTVIMKFIMRYIESLYLIASFCLY